MVFIIERMLCDEQFFITACYKRIRQQKILCCILLPQYSADLYLHFANLLLICFVLLLLNVHTLFAAISLAMWQHFGTMACCHLFLHLNPSIYCELTAAAL